MFYYEEKADKKPGDIAKDLNTTSEKISEWAKDLERYGVIKFSRSGYGSLMFKESDIKVLREYGLLKSALGNPKDAIEILKETDVMPTEQEDMSWTKELKFAILRRH